MILLSLIAALFLLSATGVDVFITDRGIRTGVAEEGNSIIRAIIGSRPTLTQLSLYEGSWFVLLTGLSLYFAISGNIISALFFGSSIAKAGLHLKGFLAWHRLGVRL